MKARLRPLNSFFVSSFTTMAVLAGSPAVQAQQLEEIVVTAQRRTQSLQDVPLSIETVSGQDIIRQGYRDLVSMSDFTPGVDIRPLLEDTRVTIRGFGTTGNNLTQEQAVPIFVDGVHNGRQEQSKLAFMDVDRVEILKGPQPVFFGQNATSGAFNIISRKPTPEWEANADGEIGRFSTQKFAAGAGGPITDTLGIRVAGKYETSAGYLRDIVDGRAGPDYKNLGGRVILQWNPSDNLQITGKYEHMKLRMGGQAGRLCLTGASLIYGRNGPGSAGMPQGHAVWDDAPNGIGWAVPHEPLPDADSKECFTSRGAISNSGPYYDVPSTVREQAVTTAGMVDMRAAGQAYTEDLSDPTSNGRYKGIYGYDDMDSDAAYIDIAYTFDNGVNANWLTSYSNFTRGYVEDNRSTPFFTNFQGRGQLLDQWSSELRFSSDTGGMIEWMVGGSWQINDYDIYSGNFRATTYESFRMNTVWEDTEWASAFASLTFNFLDNRASIDLGGRYSDVKKSGLARGYTSQWVFNVQPVSANPAHYRQLTPEEADIYLPYNPAAGLWAMNRRASRVVPVEWRGTAAAEAIGRTKPDFARRSDGPYFAEFHDKEIDPQVTFRYRHTDDMSFFLRWAQAFKSGGFDTGQTTFASSLEEFTFDLERSETYEAGVKGNLWDGRARYDVTLFETTFTDLQLITLNPDPNNPSNTVNAGGQRVRGIELGFLMAATDQLTLGLNGSIMDGVMTDYKGAGCNDFEVVTAPESGCVLVNPSDPTFGGFIDRTGAKAPYTPDYKFVGTVDYWMPVFNNHKVMFNAKGYYSDGYADDSETFTQAIRYPKHGDINMSIGYGDTADTWMISVYARNLLQATQRYYPEFTDPAADAGFIQIDVDQTMTTTYGLKFEYYYR